VVRKYFGVVTLVACRLFPILQAFASLRKGKILLRGHPCDVHFVVWQAFALSLCGSGLGLNPYTRGKHISLRSPLWRAFCCLASLCAVFVWKWPWA